MQWFGKRNIALAASQKNASLLNLFWTSIFGGKTASHIKHNHQIILKQSRGNMEHYDSKYTHKRETIFIRKYRFLWQKRLQKAKVKNW